MAKYLVPTIAEPAKTGFLRGPLRHTSVQPAATPDRHKNIAFGSNFAAEPIFTTGDSICGDCLLDIASAANSRPQKDDDARAAIEETDHAGDFETCGCDRGSDDPVVYS